MIMMSWTSANWDVPPGRWLAVTGLTASAVLLTAALSEIWFLAVNGTQPPEVDSRTWPLLLHRYREARI